jgi:hypothetical protein
MRRLLASLALAGSALALPLLSGCENAPPPPGYTGPIVDVDARDALAGIAGQTFRDVEGVFGGGNWKVGQLSVTPYPDDPSRKGPHVVLEQAERRIVLPMEADGDAADLYRRVVGTPNARLGTVTSEAYRKALARAGQR